MAPSLGLAGCRAQRGLLKHWCKNQWTALKKEKGISDVTKTATQVVPDLTPPHKKNS